MKYTALWLNSTLSIFGFSIDLPEWVRVSGQLILIYLWVILPSCLLIAYLDRKLAADFQARVGPAHAGPRGILQPIADLLKLLQKSKYKDWHWKETFWFSIQTMALYATVAMLPLGSAAILVDTDMSAFLPFWSALVLALSSVLLGFSQKSVSGWLGGLRIAAQAFSGVFPAIVALLCVGVRVRGFRWSVIVGAQGFSPLHWNATADPFQFVAMLLFLSGGMILLGIAPMNSGFISQDMHGGISSRFSGHRFGMLQLGRLYSFFLWALITVVVFLGAWKIPAQLTAKLLSGDDGKFVGFNGQSILQWLELFWLVVKTFSLMLFIVWVARVNPRSRVDQITDFAWKVLSPLSLVALIGTCVIAAWQLLWEKFHG